MKKVKSEHESEDEAEFVIPLVEEEAVIGRRLADRERVRVRTLVEEREQMLREAVRREDVEIERVAINREVDATPSIRTEGDVTIIPIVEEQVVVDKVLVLTEELHVRKRARVENVETPVRLRAMRAVIDTHQLNPQQRK